MNRLLSIGFKPIGCWVLVDREIHFELQSLADRKNVLYAFICNGQVMYVGKTVMTLRQRMSGYKNPGPSQSTNIRIRAHIVTLLSNKSDVDIFVLPDDGLHRYGPFHLNLAAALEDDIIRVIKPHWNGRNLWVSPDEIKVKEWQSDSEPEHAIIETKEFPLVLHATYFNYGFFNVGIKFQSLIGADGETIQIGLGHSNSSFLGYINRRANATNVPRIMGGAKLRDWFQSHAEIGDTIQVSVLSPQSIRIQTL